MDSLAFQIYALDNGLDELVGENNVELGHVKDKAAVQGPPKKFDWTADESDSDSDSDDQESPLNIVVKNHHKPEDECSDEDGDDDDDDEDDDDEVVTGITVNWLDDSDEEVEEDETTSSTNRSSSTKQSSSPPPKAKTSISTSSENNSSSARIVDLIPFFKSPKLNVRVAVATQVAGLSSTVEGRALINSPLIMQHLCRLLGGDDKEAKPALQALINMCQLRVFKMNLAKMGIVRRLISSVMDKYQKNLRNLQCMLLSNVTQDSRGSRELLDLDGESKARSTGTTLKMLVQILVSGTSPNQEHQKDESRSPQYLAHLFINVTQLQEGRDVLLDKDSGVLVSLLPYFESKNEVLRQGIVGTLKNLCHELKHLSWLLSSEVNALGRTMRLLSSGKERDTSVLILSIELLVVVVSTSQGKTILRQDVSIATLRKIGSLLNSGESSVPKSSKEKFDQVLSIAEGKSDHVVVKRDVKPGDVIPI